MVSNFAISSSIKSLEGCTPLVRPCTNPLPRKSQCLTVRTDEVDDGASDPCCDYDMNGRGIPEGFYDQALHRQL